MLPAFAGNNSPGGLRPPGHPHLFGRRASDWIRNGIQIEDQIWIKDSTFGDSQNSIKIAPEKMSYF